MCGLEWEYPYLLAIDNKKWRREERSKAQPQFVVCPDTPPPLARTMRRGVVPLTDAGDGGPGPASSQSIPADSDCFTPTAGAGATGRVGKRVHGWQGSLASSLASAQHASPSPLVGGTAVGSPSGSRPRSGRPSIVLLSNDVGSEGGSAGRIPCESRRQAGVTSPFDGSPSTASSNGLGGGVPNSSPPSDHSGTPDGSDTILQLGRPKGLRGAPTRSVPARGEWGWAIGPCS
jgi:hypothetical protein